MKTFLLVNWLEKRSRLFWELSGFGTVILLGLADYVVSFKASIPLFYLVPVGLVSWFVSRELGLVMATSTGITWFLVDFLSGAPSFLLLHIWNTILRLGFFYFVVVVTAALKKSLKKAEELAHTDYLTGAASLGYFYDLVLIEITRMRRYGHPFTLAHISPNNFKEILDRFGHSLADQVLRGMVISVRQDIRSTDTIARLSGGEFALLLPETGEAEAQVVISRLNSNLLAEIQKNGWTVTFRIGVITYIDPPASVDEVIKDADEVMYSLKDSPKNGVVYTLQK